MLRGECLLLIEGEERRLKAWDFDTVRPGQSMSSLPRVTARVCTSASAPATSVRASSNPVSELALRHGVGVTVEATTGEVAYAGSPKTVPGPYPEGVLANSRGWPGCAPLAQPTTRCLTLPVSRSRSSLTSRVQIQS